jgi:hydrogenase assembly chaperone HypC/HupF
MCIAFPGRVAALDESGAVVESDGRRRRASTLLVPDVAVGDWVAVAAGTIVGRLEEHEAVELQALLRAAISPAEEGSVTFEDQGGDRNVAVA